MDTNSQIITALEIAAPILPTPVYWLSKDGVVLGINEHCLKAIGATPDIIGKTPYEFYPNEIAKHIIQHNTEVIQTGKILSQEEPIEDITTGEVKYFSSIKAPLHDDQGNIIGIVGSSIDITAEKEAERLKLENEAHKVQLQEQEKFTKIAAQVAHDIKSPTASLLMLLKSCQDIPEKERIALREATMRIQDIANNLLNQYQQQDSTNIKITNETPEPMLASGFILQVLAEKKLQYQDSAIKFDYECSQIGHFAFINMEPSAFKRMLSNLINNAVDACDPKMGKITLKLEADKDLVNIYIQDNGKGMTQATIAKIMNNISLSEGKANGHGIGLTQVRETLARNQGKMTISSQLGQGTQISLSFPRIKAPSWIAESIQLAPDDIIVILDDDSSIHSAWDAHFEPILAQTPSLKIRHFSDGRETLNFITMLPPEQKQKVFLLSDYELLKQDLNGLDVIEQVQLPRSILVTSHYANKEVRARAAQSHTRILPKLLASEIPINIESVVPVAESSTVPPAEMVVMDDSQMFLELLVTMLSQKRKVEGFLNPHHFLARLAEFPKDTIICFDYDFQLPDIDGLRLAEQLHAEGYTRLYLVSGMSFTKDQIPDYVTLVDKCDLGVLEAL